MEEGREKTFTREWICSLGLTKVKSFAAVNFAMNISLTPDLERYVDQKVVSGAFPSASEVVCAGLRLLEDEERLRQQRVAQIRQKVGEALE